MKTTKGKFVLFDLSGFISWLTELKVTRRIGLIQQHHTWRPDYAAWDKLPDHFHWLESMENFQVTQNGFSQIAQNMTSFPDGTIAICRPFDVIPAGIKGANQYGLCIENLGNFDIGGDAMTDLQRKTIIGMNTALLQKFNLQPSTDTIIYHHWFDIITGRRTNGTGTVKTCPGTNFFGGNKVEDCQLNLIPLL